MGEEDKDMDREREAWNIGHDESICCDGCDVCDVYDDH
jgi:hypothetical protein